MSFCTYVLDLAVGWRQQGSRKVRHRAIKRQRPHSDERFTRKCRHCMGVLFSLFRKGVQNSLGGSKYPGESGMGVPYSLGCQIPCDTAKWVRGRLVHDVMYFVRMRKA